MDSDSCDVATVNIPAEFQLPTSPSQTLSYTVQAPRSGSLLANHGSLLADFPDPDILPPSPCRSRSRSDTSCRLAFPLFSMAQITPEVRPKSASGAPRRFQLRPTHQPGLFSSLTVHNSDRLSPTDRSGTASENSSQPSKSLPEVEHESTCRTPHPSPLKQTRQLGPSPLTVPNPDHISSTDESGTASGISSWLSQPPPAVEPESAPRAPCLSPLEPTGSYPPHTVNNPDTLSPTDEGVAVPGIPSQHIQPPPEVEPESASWKSCLSPLELTHRLGWSPPLTVNNLNFLFSTDERSTTPELSYQPSQLPPEVQPESASRTHLSPMEPTRRLGSSPPLTVNSPDPLSSKNEDIAVPGILSQHIRPPPEVGAEPTFRTLHPSRTCQPVIMAQNPPERLHPTLSSWLKNMNKLSGLIDRLEELACAAPSDYRPQLDRQVATLRVTFKSQRERCIQFLRLTEEYADRYLLDISAEIQQQSSFLDMLERRLDMAKTLYCQAIDLRKSYEAGTVNVMKNARKTGKAAFISLLREISLTRWISVLSQPLPEDFDLFDEVESVLREIRRCYEDLDKFWTEEICRAVKALEIRYVDPGDVERWRVFKVSLEQTIESWKVWSHALSLAKNSCDCSDE